MAEITCQMCGKSNPEDRDVCQHCGARLTLLEAPQAGEPVRDDLEEETPSPAQDDSEEDQLGWLDELRGGEQEDELPAGITPDPLEDDPEEDQETDWLERIKRLDGDHEDEPDDSEDDFDDHFPSWMTTELGGEPETAPDPEEDQEEELPDWLQVRTDELGLEPSPEEDRDQLFGPDSEQDSADLSEDLSPAVPPDREKKPGAPTEEPDDVEPEPDEIKEVAKDDRLEEPSSEPDSLQEPSIESEPDEETPEEARPASRFPSWAANAPSSSEPRLDWEEDQEDIPEDLEFLAGLEQEDPEPADQPDEPAEESVDPFAMEAEDEEELFDDLFEEDLPSWLTSAVDLEDQPTNQEISPGDLPGWVEAMRPVVEQSDPTGLSEDEEYIENYGPLAGISSILPAEPDIESTAPEDEIQSAMDLSVSKTQQDYAELLEKVIARESKVRSVREPVSLPTQRILRWLITIVLTLSLGAVIIFGSGTQQGESAFREERFTGAAALYNLIDDLEPGDPVLVAFDYQPALSGEFHYTASGVMDHVMSRDTYLSFVSTQATGPALAEYFLQTTQQVHEYRHGLDYINLGYLPGGGAGLLSFSLEPQTIIPLAFDGSNAWDSPPLAEVSSINDFSLILILTEDPTTAKLWVEQVQSATTPPMAMVVSAQTEPLIQPYFQTSPRQVSGYVAGILGGYAYESLTGEQHQASAAWLPFNTGILITAAGIFIGGMANGILSLYRGQRKITRGDSGS